MTMMVSTTLAAARTTPDPRKIHSGALVDGFAGRAGKRGCGGGVCTDYARLGQTALIRCADFARFDQAARLRRQMDGGWTLTSRPLRSPGSGVASAPPRPAA